MGYLIGWLLSLTPHGTPFYDTYALLINTAIYASVTAVFIIIFKFIFKNRLNARWHFLIWAILLIRLVVPVLPSSPVSVFNAVKVEESVIEQSSYQAEIITPETEEEYDINTESNFFKSKSVLQSSDDPHDYVSILNVDRIVILSWLGGAVILIVYFAIVFALYNRRLKKRRTQCDKKTLSALSSCKEKLGIKRNVWLYYADATPVLIGLFKPAIYIPDSYGDTELEAVITHELCHLKHLDILWSGIAALVLCLNWYNPVIWLSFFMFKRDLELYCDERTLKYTQNKQGYALLLLKTAAKKQFVLGTTSLQSEKSDVKRRIRYLANFKKPTVLIIIAAVLAAAIITTVCLTNAIVNTVVTSNEQEYRYEVVENTVTKYFRNEKVWSTDFLEESEATSDTYGVELNYTQTNGNDKLRLFFGDVYSTTYRVDEQEQWVGYISAVDAENGNVVFSKVFEEFADYNNNSEDTFFRAFVSAATIREDDNIDIFLVQMTHTDGFEPHYETTLITLNQKGETINQGKFNTGEMRYFSAVCETDNGYAVCGYDRNHNPDFIVAEARNSNVYSQIKIVLDERLSEPEGKNWSFNFPLLWSINGKVYLTMTKEDSDILGKYAAYDSSGYTDYSNVLQDEKDGNYAALYTVDFENETAEPYDIAQSLSGNEIYTDESGNIYYKVIKITAESAQYSFPVSNEPFENCEYWIYVFDSNGNPINNFSTNTPAKTYLPFELIEN